MNYFAYTTAAERYAKNRPYLHPIAVEKIKTFLGIETPLARALDVACGTGQSTKALTDLAQHVIGIDVSEEMLVFARANHHDNHIAYINAPAEQLPFANMTFDLITVSLAFHWLDRERFLREANRVLKASAWLAIYNNIFTAVMKENPAFELFIRDVYALRYPQPPRNNQPLPEETYKGLGFQVVSSETYSNEVIFTNEALVNYLMTQSNIIAKVEQGTESANDVYTWLMNSVQHLLPNGQGTFLFKGYILYLQKLAISGNDLR